jgi:hypothetical protein
MDMKFQACISFQGVAYAAPIDNLWYYVLHHFENLQ